MYVGGNRVKELFDKLYNKSEESFYEILEKNLSQNKKTFIVTANPETFMMSEKDEEMRKLLLDNDTFLVPDGIGIVKAARMINYDVKERITGIDIANELLKLGNKQKKSIYLFGAKQEVIDSMEKVLKESYPNLNLVGMSNGYEKDKDKIFARFFQADNQEKKGSLFSGTGIGLALTRTIVEKHHGEITVKSVVGEGSTFTVRLPRRKDVFLNDKNVQFYTQDSESDIIPDSMPVFVDEGNSPIELIETKDTENKTHTVLLVEDNDELLQVLKELFEPFYKIICAHDGKEGLSQIYENSPDLVISDVMMPEMTGTEMCLQIKNNIDLCHIPVILLTALNSTEQNIEGLSRGADDYITKPFHAQLLLARANNLIRSRLLMQHQFDKKPMSEIDLASINPLDKDLLKRASQVIEQHIDDTEFDIPALCKEVGVGRSLLYTKFKALTGMTPNNFLLNYRLKHAATLLKQYPDLPIAEVSDRSGFNAPVYFSRCFKNQFGCTPQNYRKEKKQAD